MPTTITLTKRFNQIELLLAKTIEYLTVPAVVGHEHVFMRHLKSDFAKLGLNIQEYDGLLEVSGNTPLSAIVCAHIDRHGLISLGGGQYAYAAQYMRETKYGERNLNSEAEMKSIIDRFAGETIYAYDDATGKKIGKGLISKAEECPTIGHALFNVDDMIDVQEGTALAYRRTAELTDEYFKGQLDNTLSIGTVYALFKSGFQGTALLTCEEEIGKSWVHIRNYLQTKNISTQNLIVIDTSPFINRAPIKEGRLVFRNRDRHGVFNSMMLEEFKKRCKVLDIPIVIKDEFILSLPGKTLENIGSTELGRLINHTEGQWSGTTVQVPTLSYHTSRETTSKTAILNYFRFLKDILIKNPVKFDYRVNESASA